MRNRQRQEFELPDETVSLARTELNRQVFQEGRDELDDLRQRMTVGESVKMDRGEFQTVRRVVSDAREDAEDRAERMDANIFGDTDEQAEFARQAEQGLRNNPPEFGAGEGTPRRSPDSGFFTAAPTQPTDIGREADGEFARPESSPNIEPAPIDRDRKTGEFGIDPFDMTAGGGVLDSAENLFGGDR
jgi:hypothetical protein